jgi:membrane protease YdiL (CAAX protease family)
MSDPYDDPQAPQDESSESAPYSPDAPPGVPVARPLYEGVPVARPLSAAIPLSPPPHPMLLADSPLRFSYLLDVFVAMVCLVVLEFVFTPLVAASLGFDMESLHESSAEITQALLVPILQLRVAYILLIVAVVLRLRRQSWASVGMTSRRVGVDVLIGLGCPLVAYALIIPIMLLLMLTFPAAFEQMNQNAQNLQALLPDIPLWHYLPVMAIVGVWEELFFRGFVMTRLRRVTGSWIAGVVLSTLIFALLHLFEQTFTALVPITILSILFSVVTIWRRSLLPAIVGHALFNFSQVAWMNIMSRYLEATGS